LEFTDYFHYVDKIKKNLKEMDFYRIFLEKKDRTAISINDQKVEKIFEGADLGVGIFTSHQGFGQFYSTNDLEKAIKYKPQKAKIKNMEYTPSDSIIKEKIIIGKPLKHNKEEIIKRLIQAGKIIDKRIKSLESTFASRERNTLIVTPQKEIEQKIYYNLFYTNVTAKEGSNVREGHERIAKTTAINNELNNLDEFNQNAQINTIKKLEYKEGLKGNFEVIIDSDLTHLLAHEAIGHASESDLVYNNRSVLKEKIGHKIAPEFVNLTDDPSITEKSQYGEFKYDDEGVLAQNKYLIKNGKVNELIYDDKYAQLMNTQTNGSARCESYSYLPIPRMSNTQFLPGESKLDEMIAEMKKGILLMTGHGGQVDPANGVFQFGVKEAYLIEKGEIKENYVNLTFGGNILNSLENILEISKDRKFLQPGTCGKSGQGVPVDGSGPFIKIKNINIGK
jgi:TldD protein